MTTCKATRSPAPRKPMDVYPYHRTNKSTSNKLLGLLKDAPFLDIASDLFPRKSEDHWQTQVVDQDVAYHEPQLRIQSLDRCRPGGAGPKQIARSWAKWRFFTRIFQGKFMEMWNNSGTGDGVWPTSYCRFRTGGRSLTNKLLYIWSRHMIVFKGNIPASCLKLDHVPLIMYVKQLWCSIRTAL